MNPGNRVLENGIAPGRFTLESEMEQFPYGKFPNALV
jgi:hypothetical protein